MLPRPATILPAFAGLLFLLAACSSGPPPEPVIGEAYVGPAELKLRSDIPLESPPVATVKHGERLEILRQRRNIFFRVRTSSGDVGWTEARQLLSQEDMDSLEELSERAKSMPSQGNATTYDDLRIHNKPSRTSPGFVTIKDGGKVDVLAHLLLPRVNETRKPLIPPPPKKQKVAKKPRTEKIAPPPAPAPPPPPKNWVELSKTNLAVTETANAPDAAQPPEEKPVPMDYWSLVRTPSGQAGWVLTRPLIMAIPDEIAQYAEGRRIVSYFKLSEVRDGEQVKGNWLWTTLSGGPQTVDFDGFRVFIWNMRRSRYETAYSERNIKGYLPVLLKDVSLAGGTKSQENAAVYPGFSVCLEKADGSRWRREYAFVTNVVRFAGEGPCELPNKDLLQASGKPLPASPATPAESAVSIFEQWRKRLSSTAGRWFKR